MLINVGGMLWFFLNYVSFKIKFLCTIDAKTGLQLLLILAFICCIY